MSIAKYVEEKRASTWVETPAKVIESSLSYTDEWEMRVLYEWRDDAGKSHRSRRVTFAIRAWRAWRNGVEPPEFDVVKWLRPNSPLIVAAVVYLFESYRPVIREIQLGVHFSMTQIVAILAVLLFGVSLLLIWLRRPRRTKTHH